MNILLFLSAVTNASPIGSLWITNDDYPQSELQRAIEGTVAVTLIVTQDGRVSKCIPTSSSGSEALDITTCLLFKERGRFEPARDATGKPVESSYAQRVTWKVPNQIAQLPPSGFVSSFSLDVDVNDRGQIEACKIIKGSGSLAYGEASPCLAYPVGKVAQRATDAAGKAIPYTLVVRQSFEFKPR